RGPATRKGAATPARDSQAASDSALRQRVEQLEEQLVDMQVAVGTLESLARGTAAPAAAGGGRQGAGPAGPVGAADAGRLDSLETQIRALAAQLEHVQEPGRGPSPRPRQLAGPGGHAAGAPGAPRRGRPQIERGSPQPERTQFGSVTVSPGAPKDEIDRILTSPPQTGAGPLPQMAAAPPGPAEMEQSPKQLYETAYGYLLQRDYGAAEAAFDEFL